MAHDFISDGDEDREGISLKVIVAFLAVKKKTPEGAVSGMLRSDSRDFKRSDSGNVYAPLYNLGSNSIEGPSVSMITDSDASFPMPETVIGLAVLENTISVEDGAFIIICYYFFTNIRMMTSAKKDIIRL
ncbi:MAG: hypothetical protein ACI4TU_06970 [Candidatus Cryptobacteroides sp.]